MVQAFSFENDLTPLWDAVSNQNERNRFVDRLLWHRADSAQSFRGLGGKTQTDGPVIHAGTPAEQRRRCHTFCGLRVTSSPARQERAVSRRHASGRG
jgi:hypothetical protein